MKPTEERIVHIALALCAVLATAALWWPLPASAVRLKEVATVQGVRANQLIGYGLVVGLDGTGEQSAVTAQSLSALLQSLGVTLPPGVVPQGRNTAAVMVTVVAWPAFGTTGLCASLLRVGPALGRAAVLGAPGVPQTSGASMMVVLGM